MQTAWRYGATIWRWKWIIVPLVVLPVVAAALLSKQQQKQYRATAQVLIEDGGLANALANLPSTRPDPDNQIRVLETQATLARSNRVAQLVADRAGNRDAASVLAASSVTPDRNADILTFSYTDPDPGTAVVLANAYAEAFTTYRRNSQAESIRAAAREVDTRLRRLANRDEPNERLRATLEEKRDQLETLAVVQTSNAEVVNPAVGVTKAAPRTKRNVALGLVAGLALAWIVTALLEARRARDGSALPPDPALDREHEFV